MTREEFEKLQIGDKVRHPLGSVGVVVSKDKMTYSLKDGLLDNGNGLDVVSFAWNEGEIVSNDTPVYDKAYNRHERRKLKAINRKK
jgi:hypothetical protein